MGAKAAAEFPHSFDGVEIGAIRRQKHQLQFLALRLEPWLQIASMVVFGVVQNYKDLFISPATA